MDFQLARYIGNVLAVNGTVRYRYCMSLRPPPTYPRYALVIPVFSLGVWARGGEGRQGGRISSLRFGDPGGGGAQRAIQGGGGTPGGGGRDPDVKSGASPLQGGQWKHWVIPYPGSPLFFKKNTNEKTFFQKNIFSKKKNNRRKTIFRLWTWEGNRYPFLLSLGPPFLSLDSLTLRKSNIGTLYMKTLNRSWQNHRISNSC